MSHIKQCLITLRFFPKAALTHLTRYQQINFIPSCITCTRGQYTVTKFNCRLVKKVFEKNLGMGEWAPLFFGASSPTLLPPFYPQCASSHTATGPAAQQRRASAGCHALSCMCVMHYLAYWDCCFYADEGPITLACLSDRLSCVTRL